jgi:integrase
MYSGLRVGEALDLTWEDIDFERKLIYVHSRLKKVRDRSKPKTEKGKWQYRLDKTLPKTSTSIRTIPLALQAIEALNIINNITKPKSDKEHIYITDNKKIIDAKTLTAHLQRMLFVINADNTDIGVHGLRHTFATMLFNADVDIKTISKLLGHSNVEITYNIYIHVIKEREESAISVIEKL